MANDGWAEWDAKYREWSKRWWDNRENDFEIRARKWRDLLSEIAKGKEHTMEPRIEPFIKLPSGTIINSGSILHIQPQEMGVENFRVKTFVITYFGGQTIGVSEKDGHALAKYLSIWTMEIDEDGRLVISISGNTKGL